MSNSKANTPVGLLSFLFFLSGVSSLVYQVSWQRILFSVFGADIQSTTIVVSAFMLGLGVGAIGGGIASDKFPTRPLLLFALCEVGIGSYGLISYMLIKEAGSFFAVSRVEMVAVINFSLVLIPATLMGGTLPILVRHVARLWGNVGKATGQMYSSNTLGAALGAVLCGFVLLNYLSLSQVLVIAALINLSVAFVALLFLRKRG